MIQQYRPVAGCRDLGVPSAQYRSTHSLPTPTKSKHPIFKDSGPKSHTLHGISDQSHHCVRIAYLDPLSPSNYEVLAAQLLRSALDLFHDVSERPTPKGNTSTKMLFTTWQVLPPRVLVLIRSTPVPWGPTVRIFYLLTVLANKLSSSFGTHV